MTNVNDELERLFPGYYSSERAPAWKAAKQRYAIGAAVRGVVVAKYPFGVFVDLEAGFPGLILVTLLKDADKQAYTAVEMFPSVGSTLEAIVLGWVDGMRQIALTQLPLGHSAN